MRRAILVGLLLAAPLAGQEQVYLNAGSPAWLGINYEPRWVQHDSGCAAQATVVAVVQGAPADRAGIRAGDIITAVNDEPVAPGRLQTLASDLAPGDSITLRFRRGGRSHEVTAIAGPRPDRPLRVYLRDPAGLWRSAAPVVEHDGPSLVVSNVAADWDPARTRSYWVREDGRTEYRTLDGWSRSELDERVADLLACADSLRTGDLQVRLTANRQVTLQQVQARADSLRVIITRRAMQRADDLESDTAHRVRARTGQRNQGGTLNSGQRTDTDAFNVGDHVAAGFRGVAGAELSAMEPELADYFRNVDQGLLVLRIAPRTPAHRAGLRPGDVIIAADGRHLESVGELRRIIALPQAGDVDLRVVRRGRIHDLSLRRR